MNRLVLDARTATDHFPGIGRYVVNLASSLSKVAPDLGLTLLIDPSASSARLSLPDLPRQLCAASPFSIQQQWLVPQVLRQTNATLYHSPYYLMPYRPGVPTVLTCYDLIPLVWQQYFSAANRLIYRLAHMLALRAARVVITLSQSARSDLVRHFGIDPGRIHVTPVAADAHFKPQPSPAINAVREKFALPERYVLYFGSNKPHKNLARLVDAITQMPITLVIGGTWDERFPQAQQRAKELNASVRFIGQVNDDDLPALYSGATVFAFPSFYEGFGLPPLEAMACGTPVICSNTSSLPEVVGDAALQVNPNDVNEIAAAIARVLDDPGLRDEMRDKSLARAAQFSWERTARETLAIYHSLTH